MMPRARRASIGAVAMIALACPGPARDPGTVTYASGSDLESANPLVTIHPLARQIQRHAIFVTLARYDDALQPVSYGAARWDWSDDRRGLRFVLHPGIMWSDGRPTTAQDAKWTLDAARDPAIGYFRSAELSAIDSVIVVDDTTFAIHFAAPPPSFPSILAELPILPRHALREVPASAMRTTAFATAPITNGPFRFVSRTAGQRWIFERNPRFPDALGGPPSIARLVVAVVDEPTTKFAGLVSGELDVAGIAPTMAALARRDPGLEVLDYPVLFSYALVFNASQPALKDARVRRAISAAIDRERIVQAALAGFASPAAGPVPPDHPWSASNAGGGGSGSDIALADSLLDDAGWLRAPAGVRYRGGVPLRFSLATVGSGTNVAEQLIQADLAARGIQVSIQPMELAAFLSLARGRDKRFDMLFTGIPGDLSLSHLIAMHHSRQAGGSLDYAGYHHPALDSLLDTARLASADAASAAWRAVLEYFEREMPVAWIYHARGVQGISRRLAGVRMDLRGELATLQRWSVARDRQLATGH